MVVEEPRICEPGGGGLFLPLGGDAELNWDPRLKVFLYGTGLLYSFMGVSIVADIFMSAIERITSKKKRVIDPGERRIVTKNVWNETVANLTLMALGSSAPEILLAINDVLKNSFFAGKLGPSTIVGSAAFNLFMIIAVCINAIPNGETREIKEVQVFHLTAGWSIFAYLWLLIIVRGTSPDVVDLLEGIITVLLFPLLVSMSYASDIGLLSKKNFCKLLCCCCRRGKGADDHDGEAEETESKGSVPLLGLLRSCIGTCCTFLAGFYRRFLHRRGRGCQQPGEAAETPGDTETLRRSADGMVFTESGESITICDEEGEPLDVEEGIFTFKEEVKEVWVGMEEQEVHINVMRANSCDGRVSCNYRLEGLSAVPGYDYVETSGKLDFRNGAASAEICITLLPKTVGEADDQLQVVLFEPEGGAILDPTSDGGEDVCLLTLTLRNMNPANSLRSRMFNRLDRLLNVDELCNGWQDWKGKVREAFYCNGSKEEQLEASWVDWATHLMFLPWKLPFAVLTPPPTYLGGWLCFTVALLNIGALTAAIGDMAELFGCAAKIDDNITAITVVALGTSLPDTFASKAAAMQDEWADASIVNVTGSNSVNVFLGIGLPWLIAAAYWMSNGKNDLWIQRYEDDFGTRYPNGVFVVTGAEDLSFSVMVFTCNAFVCLGVIHLRRKVWGGELGGTAIPKACSSFLLCLLWVSYIGLSVWKTGNKNADLIEQLLALLCLVPFIVIMMILFLIFLRVLAFSKKYIGEEGFWGLFAAASVIGIRVFILFVFQMN